jgi:hypothetical protein
MYNDRGPSHHAKLTPIKTPPIQLVCSNVLQWTWEGGRRGLFKTIEDFRMWMDNIEAVCTAVFLEDQHSTTFFRRNWPLLRHIWLHLREQFRDTSA